MDENLTAQQAGGNADADRESLTVIIKRTVRKGHERELELWIDGLGAEAKSFAGYMGTDVIKPVNPDNPEYVIIFRFDTYAHLQAFYESDTRARWLSRVRDITIGEPEIRRVQGMHYWFDLSEMMGRSAPPKWKMALIIFIALYPLAILTNLVLTPYIGGLHIHLQRLISTAVIVILMTWLVMPFLTELLRGWLFRR